MSDDIIGRTSAAAALAGGIIAASGRPHSMEEAKKVFESVYFTMFANPGLSAYETWKKTFDPAKPFT